MGQLAGGLVSASNPSPLNPVVAQSASDRGINGAYEVVFSRGSPRPVPDLTGNGCCREGRNYVRWVKYPWGAVGQCQPKGNEAQTNRLSAKANGRQYEGLRLAGIQGRHPERGDEH